MTDRLKDPDLDDCHHALGRPDGPHVTPYRNRYVIGRATEQAGRMRASPNWREAATMNEGRDSIFVVTPEGIAAVWRALAEADKAAGVRAYFVTGEGLEPRVVMAKSRSAARFDVWRTISDAWSDATFRDFIETFRPRATLFRPPEPSAPIPF